MSAFEAVKHKSGGFNMFACRSIIDVCGICGDYMRSRALLKVAISDSFNYFNSNFSLELFYSSSLYLVVYV